jgi:hypothetical protein
LGHILGYTFGYMAENKVRENRVRRMAERQGLILRRSRRRDVNAIDYDAYWLVEPSQSLVYAGGQFGISLDEAQSILTGGMNEDQVRRVKGKR